LSHQGLETRFCSRAIEIEYPYSGIFYS